MQCFRSVLLLNDCGMTWRIMNNFYPRPVGLWVVSLPASVCRCKTPWSRSLLFCGTIDHDLIQGQIYCNLKVKIYLHFELVCTITHHLFKLGSPNLDKGCKIAWLITLLVLGAIELDLQGQTWLTKSNFLVSLLLETYNHLIATREPWVPRLLYRPDCFMVSILCMFFYT